MAQHLPWFQEAVIRMQEGGRELISINIGQNSKKLAIEVINVSYLNTPYLFITFQDIQTEIAQKEVEAWHDVIRVLAHEMMNSFTPVSSLASTIVKLSETDQGVMKKELSSEDIEDIYLSAKTIDKRSKGLLEFVNDYRTISNVPLPHIKKVLVAEIVNDVIRLLQDQITTSNVDLTLNIPPRSIVHADEKLIHQVLINLVSNAIHAMDTNENKVLNIECVFNEGRTILEISDNGRGISRDIIDKIFIPFFTTRKDGSGIGLSLSKSIMDKHGGDLFVNSVNGKTTFSMVFKK